MRMFLSSDSRDKTLLELEKKKLDSLQRQAQTLKALRDRTQEVEDERKKKEEEILGRLNGSLLKREIKDWYGPEAKTNTVINYSLPKTLPPPATYHRPAVKPRLLDDVLARRRQEHERKQADIHDNIKSLNAEKVRILREKERLQDKRRELRNPSPYSVLEPFHFPSRPPSQRTDSAMSERSAWLPSHRTLESVHSARSIIEKARLDLTPMQLQLRTIKDDFYRERMKHDNMPYMGDLGINSYEPWQYEDYYLMRELVMELVDKVVSDYQRPPIPAADHKTALKIARVEETEAAIFKKYHSHDRAMQLIHEELLLEITKKMTKDTILEYLTLQRMARKMADHLTVNTAESIAIGDPKGRNTSDPAYHMITKTHGSYRKERDEKRKDIWAHTQSLHYLGKKVAEPSQPIQQQQKPSQQPPPQQQEPSPPTSEVEQKDGPDVKILQFHDIAPYHLRPNSSLSSAFQLYRQQEALYWQEMYTVPSDIRVSRKIEGVESTALSPNHRLLALGSVHGDIFVYDLWYDPPRVIRLIHNEGTSGDPVINIVWSMDALQLITLNESGALVLWNMIAAGISQRNMKELEIRTENDGVLPTQLTQSSVMDAQNYDFNFQRGPLAESGSQKAVYGPLISSFHPALTLLGTQRHIIVGLQNGDVLRCDMETLKDSISTHKVIHDTIPSETPNLIGQDISAELFRGHKGQLIYIGFINNNGQMITVDNKGYIFTWRYHKRNLSHFGWFEPNKKYRLDLSEKTYIPTSNVAPKIYFQEPPPSQTGKSKKSKKTTEDPAVEAERAQAEQMIQRQRLDSQSPWHQDYDPQTQNMTYLYSPKTVEESGSLFYIVQRNMNTGKLITFLARHYRPVLNKVSRLISCKQTPSGGELVFMLLFPSYDIKGPHITFVSVDLHKFKIMDLNITVELSEDQHQQCIDDDVCSFDISRVHDATGADYILCNINGLFMGYSLNTGSLIMSPTNEDFVGLKLDPRYSTMTPASHIVVASFRGQFMVIQCPKKFQNVKQPRIGILNFLDKNSPENRTEVWKSFNTWDNHHVKAPVEQTGRRTQWLMDGDENCHTVLYLRQLVLQLIDDAIQHVDGDFPPDVAEKYTKQDRIQPFSTAELLQTESESGTVYPNRPSRAGSLLSQRGATIPPSRGSQHQGLAGAAREGTNPPIP